MCINDIRLSRWITNKRHTPNVLATASFDLPRNPQRIGLSITCFNMPLGSATLPRLSWDGVLYTNISDEIYSRDFTILTIGNLIKTAFSATNPHGTSAVDFWITEYFLPEKVLQAYIQQFEREFDLLPR